MGLIAEDISKNQEVELFISLFFGDLEPTYKKNKTKKKHIDM